MPAWPAAERERPEARPSDRGHDLRVLRCSRREEAEQARGRLRDGQLRDRARIGGVRRRDRLARPARRGGRVGRVQGSASDRRGRCGAAGPGSGAPLPAARLGCADAAGARARDDPAAPVRRLAVALAPAGDSSGALGRLAVPPGCALERTARRRDDGHADLDRHARSVGLVALRAVPRRRGRSGDADGL